MLHFILSIVFYSRFVSVSFYSSLARSHSLSESEQDKGKEYLSTRCCRDFFFLVIHTHTLTTTTTTTCICHRCEVDDHKKSFEALVIESSSLLARIKQGGFINSHRWIEYNITSSFRPPLPSCLLGGIAFHQHLLQTRPVVTNVYICCAIVSMCVSVC